MTGMAKMMMLRGGSGSRSENESRSAENRRKTVIIHENDPRRAYGEMEYNMMGQGNYRSGQMENRGEQMYGRAEMNYDRSEMNYGTESRRYKNGRFAPKNENMGRSELRLIGFDRGQDVYPDDQRIEYGGDRVGATYEPPYMNEMEHRKSPMKSMQRPHSKMAFGPEIAKEWMQGMPTQKWGLDEVSSLLRKKGLEEDPYEVWVGMNALYSDIGKVCEKYGMTSKDFFLDAAIAYWLYDKDSVEDKLGMYYECIVKK